MIRTLPLALPLSLAALVLSLPATAQDAPSPNQVVAEANAEEWVKIAPEDLLVMTLAPDRDGEAREVVIQLMPEPFSQGWVANIRTLARAGWYDGISVNRVQDNYVVQWGDPNYDNPEAEGAAKPLPDGLRVMDESDYVDVVRAAEPGDDKIVLWHPRPDLRDIYAQIATFAKGWPIGIETTQDTKAVRRWPVHCYGMVGVGRGMSPDTGSGAELYTVIGHAPRHLDRNIALVGRIVSGMEYLSSLPRGTGDLGFYTSEEADERTPILSIRVASDLPAAEQPKFEYLSTAGGTFLRYAEARANRRDPFFIMPAGGADICNIPVPLRAAPAD
ncbi:peptidylprolyl isomerase [Qipengyuania pelagi]|uniref:peptidylprolyl isomerase n=1 Tax=Qipengyuania pelagi TaxID=994320 RepID=A0A844Y3V5_9SPHN|nr:peptidylprolyl isomerase [Qipengyuania pelagi]MXO52764.1 peptidylprolyl isomerase [Qipengyuania pelagi]